MVHSVQHENERNDTVTIKDDRKDQWESRIASSRRNQPIKWPHETTELAEQSKLYTINNLRLAHNDVQLNKLNPRVISQNITPIRPTLVGDI